MALALMGHERHLVCGLDGGGLSDTTLKLPVEVRVVNHLLDRWCTPLRLVAGGVCVGDERDVVAAGETAVDGGADAGVGLGTGDNDMPDAEILQNLVQDRPLEGIPVGLRDQTIPVFLLQFRDEFPLVGVR